MTDALTLLAVALLAAIGIIHFYWAFGGKRGVAYAIPTRGGEPLFRPMRIVTFMVGLVMLGFAPLAGLLGFYDLDHIAWKDELVVLGWLVSGVFLVRAVGEFNTVGFFKKVRDTAFAKYDTCFYSPLCLFLGFVFGLLAYLA